MRFSYVLPAIAFVSSIAGVASANPRPLPFTYPYETLPAGEAELEQYVDHTPVKKFNEDRSKKVFDGNYRLQTEFEYGITDHLELGLYLVFKQEAPEHGDPAMKFDGTKQRLRYRLAEEGKLPIDVAFYLETGQFHDEFEIEEKIILSKRFENLKIMANLWFEQEWARGKSAELILNPTIGLSYQLDPMLSLGIEYWGRGVLENEAAEGGKTPTEIELFNASFHHYVGPAVMLNFGKIWWTTAAYLRADHFSRNGEVGDKFGKVWIRSVLGVNL